MSYKQQVRVAVNLDIGRQSQGTIFRERRRPAHKMRRPQFPEIATAAKPCEIHLAACKSLAGLRCKFLSAGRVFLPKVGSAALSKFCSGLKIQLKIRLKIRGIRDGQNSCCTCHNTKGWKHICVLRKQAGNKLFTVHSSVLTLYFDFDFGGSDNREDALKIALGKNVRSAQLASKSTNLRPGTQKTFGRKNPGTGSLDRRGQWNEAAFTRLQISGYLDIRMSEIRISLERLHVSNRNVFGVYTCPDIRMHYTRHTRYV